MGIETEGESISGQPANHQAEVAAELMKSTEPSTVEERGAAFEKAGTDSGAQRAGSSASGDWVSLEGRVLMDGAGQRVDAPDPYHNPEDFKNRLGEIGHFAVNNGMLGFTDVDGNHYEGPATERSLKKLQELGFTEGSVGVLLSNLRIAQGGDELRPTEQDYKLREERPSQSTWTKTDLKL